MREDQCNSFSKLCTATTSCYSSLKLSLSFLVAINDACLVFDHRLVINTAHSTNDPKVLATGPPTMYSRAYYMLTSGLMTGSVLNKRY